MIPLLGKTLNNRYRIEEHIGRGGMAEVYRAYDTQRGVDVALKILREDLAEDKVFLRRFEREARTLAELQHPNIVRFYGFERSDGYVYILMDFIHGKTLRKIISERELPFTEKEVLEILDPVCRALHFAHQAGRVHCDVKSSNIMVQEDGQVFLMDFGIARGMDAVTSTMVGIGTPAYMAPELIRGEDPTPQTDIYALGIVLYEMLTGGERPFTGERATITGTTAEKVRWEHLSFMPKDITIFNPKVPKDYCELITTCLEKKKVDRPINTISIINLLQKKDSKTAHDFVSQTNNRRQKMRKNQKSQKLIIHYLDLFEGSIELHDECIQNIVMSNETADYELQLIRCFSSNIRCVDVSHDRKQIVTGTMDHRLNLWNVDSNTRIYTQSNYTDVINCVTFSRQGNYIICGSWNGEIALIDYEKGINLHYHDTNSSGIWSLAVSYNDKYIVSGLQNSDLCILATRNFNQIRTLNDHKDLIYCLQFSPKNDVLASSSLDSTICLWKFPEMKLLNVLKEHKNGVHSLCFSSEGNLLFSGSSDNTIKMWDIHTGSPLFTFVGHKTTINHIFCDDAQNILVSSSIDEEIIYWDYVRHTILFSIQNTEGRILKIL